MAASLGTDVGTLAQDDDSRGEAEEGEEEKKSSGAERDAWAEAESVDKLTAMGFGEQQSNTTKT